MPHKGKRRQRRVVVDTNVLVAGIAGFKAGYVRGKNPSADLLYKWAQTSNFKWLVNKDVLDEYKEVLKRLRVRTAVIGKIVNLIHEAAELVEVKPSKRLSPDPDDNCFCDCAEQGKADFVVTLNRKDFPQARLKARIISPGQFCNAPL